MGYSARYHATSLIAVFLALAIGIVIGAVLGGDAIDNTRKDLEQSLTGNLQDAREQADELRGELGRANELSTRVYPVLVRDRLRGRRIGLVAFGDLPGDVYGAIEEALEPAGGRLVGVGVVREPVDTRGLAADLAKTRFANGARDAGHVGEAGLGQVGGEVAGVDRLAHDPDPDQPPAGRLQGLLDRAVDVTRQVAEGDQADPPAAQPVADEDRVDASGELVRPAQLAAQLVGLLTRILEVAGEALLEVLAGVVDRVAAEHGADHDPNRQGEKDRDQRGGVVARAVAHRPERLDGDRGHRYRPSQILTLSQISSTRSPSAGEAITRIASRIMKAARKSGAGPSPEPGL